MLSTFEIVPLLRVQAREIHLPSEICLRRLVPSTSLSLIPGTMRTAKSVHTTAQLKSARFPTCIQT